MKCHLPEEEKQTTQAAMNLYDINKQVVSQLPALTEEDFWDNKMAIIDEFFRETGGDYYMMLCNELKYYTLFHIDTEGFVTEPFASEEACACLWEFADEIKSVELAEDGCAVEIWITKDEETYVMYLFDYTGGVIDCAR